MDRNDSERPWLPLIVVVLLSNDGGGGVDGFFLPDGTTHNSIQARIHILTQAIRQLMGAINGW
jgi:hypothetical protein